MFIDHCPWPSEVMLVPPDARYVDIPYRRSPAEACKEPPSVVDSFEVHRVDLISVACGSEVAGYGWFEPGRIVVIS